MGTKFFALGLFGAALAAGPAAAQGLPYTTVGSNGAVTAGVMYGQPGSILYPGLVAGGYSAGPGRPTPGGFGPANGAAGYGIYVPPSGVVPGNGFAAPFGWWPRPGR